MTEIDYLRRIGELSRAVGLLYGFLEGLRIDMADGMKKNADKILDEANTLFEGKKEK